MSDISALLKIIGVPHKSAYLQDDVLTLIVGKRFLSADAVLSLMEVAAEVAASLVVLRYEGLIVGISYMDYVSLTLGGSFQDFVKSWYVGDDNSCDPKP